MESAAKYILDHPGPVAAVLLGGWMLVAYLAGDSWLNRRNGGASPLKRAIRFAISLASPIQPETTTEKTPAPVSPMVVGMVRIGESRIDETEIAEISDMTTPESFFAIGVARVEGAVAAAVTTVVRMVRKAVKAVTRPLVAFKSHPGEVQKTWEGVNVQAWNSS